MEEYFTVYGGCEIMAHKRELYRLYMGREVHHHDIKDFYYALRDQLPVRVNASGVFGGIPCQAFSNTKAFRKPKFGDLTPLVDDFLEIINWDWFCFENVVGLKLKHPHKHVWLDAMHFPSGSYGYHQSRPRCFTVSVNFPEHLIQKEVEGTVDSLMAYPSVAGRLYGPKRGAVLQGHRDFALLKGEHCKIICEDLQEALSDGVHAGVAHTLAKILVEL